MREMDMNCDGARETVDTWQAGGELSDRDLSALSEHLEACSQCRRRYQAIVPLMTRDLGQKSLETGAAPEWDATFTRKVMERIGGRVRPFPRRTRVAPSTRWLRPAAVAAAALLVLAVGLLIRGVATGGQEGEVTVHFVLDAPGAQHVSLVGNFNDWNPDSLPLKREPGSQRWEISLKLRSGETYLYNFVLNGHTWIPDPTTDLQVEDGFGGESSLMQL